MRWRETAVDITCSTLPSPDVAPALTTTDPVSRPFKSRLPRSPQSLHRSKHYLNLRHLMRHPGYPYYSVHRGYCCMYVTPAAPPPTTTTTTTTTEPPPEKVVVNLEFLKNLLALYPSHAQHLPPSVHVAFKNPAMTMSQILEKHMLSTLPGKYLWRRLHQKKHRAPPSQGHGLFYQLTLWALSLDSIN